AAARGGGAPRRTNGESERAGRPACRPQYGSGLRRGRGTWPSRGGQAMEPTGMKELVIDADAHVLEPPDVWQRYIDPAYRARAIRVRRGTDGRDLLEIDGRPASLTTPEMLGGFGGMGKTMEELAHACLAGRYAESAPAAAVDPAARLALLE